MPISTIDSKGLTSPLTSGVTTNTVTSAASTALTLQSAGTTAITVNTSQNVGIGTTSPSTRLSLQLSSATTYTTSTRTNQGLTIYNSSATTNGFTGIEFVGEPTSGNGGIAGIGSVVTASGSANLVFGTRDSATYAERMRIDSSGNVMVGTTSSTARFTAVKSDSSGQCVIAIDNPDAQGTGARVSFRQNGGEQGSISNAYSGAWNLNVIAGGSGGVRLSGGATSWSSLSDERHKDVIEPIENAISKVSTLRSVIGKYKTDEEGTRRSFLIAQDVQAVLPEAVDANDPENLGLKYTEIIPLLVASIKELKTIVDAQAAEIAELKAKVA